MNRSGWRRVGVGVATAALAGGAVLATSTSAQAATAVEYGLRAPAAHAAQVSTLRHADQIFYDSSLAARF